VQHIEMAVTWRAVVELMPCSRPTGWCAPSRALSSIAPRCRHRRRQDECTVQEHHRSRMEGKPLKKVVMSIRLIPTPVEDLKNPDA
jgi:hypothetical protein